MLGSCLFKDMISADLVTKNVLSILARHREQHLYVNEFRLKLFLSLGCFSPKFPNLRKVRFILKICTDRVARKNFKRCNLGFYFP